MTYVPASFSVPATRTIATTAPLTGGGNLSADRTLAVNTFGAAQAGVVPLSGGGTANFLRADGTWAGPTATIADGDKGDIVVSGSGTVWTIDSGVVTTAKMGGDVTAAGMALLTGANAAAQRTTLGLGTLATQSGTFSGTSSGTNTGDQTSVSGNAGTATALQTGRTIGITGQVTYTSPTFDGTGNVTAAATVTGFTGTFPSANMLGSYTGITEVGAAINPRTISTALTVPDGDGWVVPGTMTLAAGGTLTLAGDSVLLVI